MERVPCGTIDCVFTGPSDLHLHSSRSDGTEPPAEVLAVAHSAGLRTVALTDHDTTAGWAEAADAARALRMTLLPGAEVSAKHRGMSVHVLGYLFDPDATELARILARVRDDRLGRAERLVTNIARDFDLSWADVAEQVAAGATVGRPHIADALIARGIVASREEAFADMLSPASPYYIAHYAPTPFEAVSAIRLAGGVPIIAHPAARGMLPKRVLRDLVDDAGLAGFELDHRENDPAGRAALAELVADRGLIATGSSDYHGTGKPNRPGENTTRDEMVRRIIDEATGTEPVYG